MKTNHTTESSIDSLKKTFSDYFSSFDAKRLIELLGSLVGGLFLGFLFKKFGRLIFVTLLCIVLLFGVASYYNFITIDWNVIKSSLGIAPTQGIENIAQSLIQFSIAHLPTVLAGGVGFILGFIVG
jgi:uncharacterized membrane protein (Fun14 family)